MHTQVTRAIDPDSRIRQMPENWNAIRQGLQEPAR